MTYGSIRQWCLTFGLDYAEGAAPPRPLDTPTAAANAVHGVGRPVVVVGKNERLD